MSKQKFPLASNSNAHNTKSRDSTSRSHHTLHTDSLRPLTRDEEVSHSSTDENEVSVMSCVSSQQLCHTLVFANGQSASFILDTGSSVNIMSRMLLRTICPDEHIRPCNIKITGITGNSLTSVGKVTLHVVENDSRKKIEFIVIPEGPPILGLSGMRSLDITISLY